MFSISAYPAAKQNCSVNLFFGPLASAALKHTSENPTQSTQHSLFSKADKKYHFGAIVAAPSFDAELHIETTTIMFADVVESVRLIEQDELTNVNRIRVLLRQLATEVVPKHHGVVLERRGDGLLVKFPDARHASRCALALHAETARACEAYSVGDLISLRAGIHTADVLADAGAVYGKTVNLTARIAAIGAPGQTVISASSCDQLTPNLDGHISDLGECYLKHIEMPLRLYLLQDRDASQTQTMEPDSRDLRPKIGVLPFEADGSATDATVAAETLAEEVSLALAKVSELTVLSRLSMMAFRNRATTAPALRELLGADYVVSGRLILLGGRFRAAVELCDARTSGVIWSDRVVDTVDNLLAGESDAVGTVCSAIGLSVLTAAIERTQSQPMPSLDSQSMLTGAISLMHRSAHQSYERAETLLSALIERHRRHPLPYAWSAKQHLLRSWRGWSIDMSSDTTRARDLAERALQANPDSSLALAVRGMVYSHVDRDFAAAGRCYDAALVANPNESLAWLFKSTMHSFCAQGELAIYAAERALQLSPLDPLAYYYQSLAASAALSATKLEKAIAYAESSRQMNRMHLSNYRVLTIAYGLRGDLENAAPIVRELMALDPQFTVSKFLAKSPGAATALGTQFADAMRFAGVPN